MSLQKVSIEIEGKEYTLETGRFARQANGAVMIRSGDTMVLVTAVAEKDPKENIDFLPLQVEYREKTASAGKIPGGFLKREGRPSDHEVLSSRLIDRPIRPMIPKTWHFETQIIATVYSADPEVIPDTLAAVGASAALMISDIPFNGPISEVRIGRVDGKLITNPSYEELEKCDIDMTIGGTDTAITMVEGESKEISEDDFLEAMEFGHQKIIELNKLQHQLRELAGVEKREFVETETPEEFEKELTDYVQEDFDKYVHTILNKHERSELRGQITEKALEYMHEKYDENEEFGEEEVEKLTGEILSKIEKHTMRKMILDESIRIDGRKLDEIRQITCEVGVLPRTHGSALFTRGETQSLSTVTLGTKHDEKMVDGLLPMHTETFMLHYNFPPFSTGETGRLMTGRREIGHGHLAWRALKPFIPDHKDFPYTLRIVSDILESNGSSSMATVCAGSLSCFDAGVPLKKAVAGIAMGLIMEDDNVAILSDILGTEDFLGDMDFKVTGTQEGITAYQMDIKIEGLSIDIMKTALARAKDGRLHILGIMNDSIDKPRQEVSNYAPRFTTLQINPEHIGSVIGQGGETIRSIVQETETEINIEDDGSVVIAATSNENAQKAIEMIKELTRRPQEGEIYKARVKEVREGLGAICEILPKIQGLLHISQISWEHTENVGDVLSVGDEIDLKLLEITRDGKYRLSRKVLLDKPEGYRDRDSDRGGDRRSSGNRRPGGSSGGGRSSGGGGNRRNNSGGSGGQRRRY